MVDPETSDVVTDVEAGNRITDHELKKVASRQSARSRRTELNKPDVDRHVKIEEADNGSNSSLSPSDAGSPDHVPRKVVSFEPDEPENPFCWHWSKKLFVVLVSIICVMNSTVSSGLASNSAPYYASEFNIKSHQLLVLATSMFLVGYCVGPVFFGPLSEQYGRRIVMIWAFAFYTIFTMGVALAPNYPALVVFRFLEGVGAACPITVVGGTCADVYKSAESRGRAMAIFMGATTFGPCAGPVISGYISTISWRWSFWVGLIFAGLTFIPLLLVPETYAPVLLKRRAAKLRKATGNPNIFAPIELEKRDVRHILSVVLTRSIRMFASEAIVLFSCLYLAFAYGIFYMFFQAYPIIYEETYGFSGGEEGLTFLAIGVGALIATAVYLLWDNILRRAREQKKPWVQREEMRRLPLACIAGPFFVVSCFWVGWTARKDIHWIVPVLAGVPYGIGYLLIFMALLNYLVDAYKIFAASAMAASSTVRSIAGAALPFAARPMYQTLGVPWACSLLGFLSCIMAVIPFVFIWKGEQLRARSKFCQYLLEKEREEEEKRERERARRELAGRETITNEEKDKEQV